MIKFTSKKQKSLFRTTTKNWSSSKMIIAFSNVRSKVIRFLCLSEIVNLIYHFFNVWYLSSLFLVCKIVKKKVLNFL